jgi:hypothetical protein
VRQDSLLECDRAVELDLGLGLEVDKDLAVDLGQDWGRVLAEPELAQETEAAAAGAG